MRDPKRIPEMLKLLEEVWTKRPDMRLGQLIVVASKPKELHSQAFSIEDDDLEANLRNFENLYRK